MAIIRVKNGKILTKSGHLATSCGGGVPCAGCTSTPRQLYLVASGITPYFGCVNMNLTPWSGHREDSASWVSGPSDMNGSFILTQIDGLPCQWASDFPISGTRQWWWGMSPSGRNCNSGDTSTTTYISARWRAQYEQGRLQVSLEVYDAQNNGPWVFVWYGPLQACDSVWPLTANNQSTGREGYHGWYFSGTVTVER